MKTWFTVLIFACGCGPVSPDAQSTQHAEPANSEQQVDPTNSQQQIAAPDSQPRFDPPSSEDRTKAIGTMGHLPSILRLAFQEGESFSPLPRPGPSDWLANHEEDGQTYDQYQRSRRNRPSESRNSIYIQPMGEFPDSSSPDLKLLQRFAFAYFASPVKIKDAVKLQGLPIKHRDRENGVRQLWSLDVLRWLEPRVPTDAHCLLAVTMEDLYPKPSWNFVFGQASLGDRVGVYSFARYDPSFDGKRANQETTSLMLQRSCKVLAHESGHMFGIKHCVHFQCVMNGSNHLKETDSRPLHLCPVCLRKLHSALQFDVVDRYGQLQRFSDSVGWNSESEWFRERLKVLVPSGD